MTRRVHYGVEIDVPKGTSEADEAAILDAACRTTVGKSLGQLDADHAGKKTKAAPDAARAPAKAKPEKASSL